MTTNGMAEAADILARLGALATCTDEPGIITRLFLSPAHARAVAMVHTWMTQAGLATSLDASGTLVGSLPGAAPNAPRLLLGSHIDTVRNAGRYDGCLGVAIAIAAAARLRQMDAVLPYTLEVRAFGDEEGVRFPITLTGAHATAGRFDPGWLTIKDADGISLGTAVRDFGLDPAALAAGACTATGAYAYLEVHIEQGPVLETADAPLGVVTAINGATRLKARVTGRAGHAGTVPMDARRDALVAAADMLIAVREVAARRPGVVATVGRLSVTPNAPNVIPGRCDFSIDLRAPEDSLRRDAWHAIREELERRALSHQVDLSIDITHEAPAVACDPRLQAAFASALAALDLPVHHLPSGAGHDAMAVAPLCPIGMLFVRCTGGLSHHPDEHVTAADVASALEVLTHVLRTLQPADLGA